jgi:hypothetical protein
MLYGRRRRQAADLGHLVDESAGSRRRLRLEPCATKASVAARRRIKAPRSGALMVAVGLNPRFRCSPTRRVAERRLNASLRRFQASLRDAISIWAFRQPWAEAHGYRQAVAPRRSKPALDTPTGCQPSGKVHGADREGASEPIADWQFADRSLHLRFLASSVAGPGVQWVAPVAGPPVSAACGHTMPRCATLSAPWGSGEGQGEVRARPDSQSRCSKRYAGALEGL